MSYFLLTDQDDVFKIAKSKRIFFADFDFTYASAVEILRKQLLKIHLKGIKKFFLNCDNLENALKWLISRILNNMRNITTNPNFRYYVCKLLYKSADVKKLILI